MEVVTEKPKALTTDVSLNSSLSSTANSVKDSTEANEVATKQEDTIKDEANYPHGFQLFLLSAACMIAVFLIALDQVGVPFRHMADAVTDSFADYPRNGDS